MISEHFAKELEELDRAIRKEAFQAVSQLDAEIASLEERLIVARILENLDIITRLEQMAGERRERRSVIAKVITQKPDEESLVVVPSAPVVAAVVQEVPTIGPVSEAPIVILAPEPPKQLEPAKEAVPPLKRKPSLTITAFRKRSKAFFEAEREFLRVEGWSFARECVCKSLVCECRALIDAARELDQDPGNLWQSFYLLRDFFNEQSHDGQFFGFNAQRSHRVETWSDLAEAYGLVPAAAECLEWIGILEVPEQQYESLLLRAAAVESWIYRIIDEAGMGVSDSAREHLHAQIEERRGEIWIPWWLLDGPRAKTTSQVAQEARLCGPMFSEVRSHHEGNAKKGVAMQTLNALVEAIDQPGDVETTLLPAVLQCLDAGIQPSRKELVACCLPFRYALAELNDPRLAKLLEYVEKEQNRLFAKHKMLPDEIPEPDEEIDGDYNGWLAAVKDRVEGKTMLFMGGKKQRERAAEIQKLLGLKELIWPETGSETTPESFRAEALRSDIVCYLIRWSRHGYKRILDLAKSEGKDTVTIKAGLGPRRLVHDLHEQLIAR
ncbi:MAG: hypothetical protein ACAH95_17705 [Fimbriimonas sp.]